MIKYVHKLSPLSEDMPPEIVQVCIDTSQNRVQLYILRHGFIVTDPVMHTIEDRIQQLDQMMPAWGQSMAESVGLCPNVSPEWQKFFDDLLQRDDSWAFLVPVIPTNSQN